ncbi:hypothetical protein ACSMEV_17580 [Pseudomonas sp. MLB6B]
MERPPTDHFLIFGDPDAPQCKELIAEETVKLETVRGHDKLRQLWQLVQEFAVLNALDGNMSVLYRMVTHVQNLGKDEEALERYVQTELSDPKYTRLREFVWQVHAIHTYEAGGSVNTRGPQWTSRLTVRRTADGYLAIDQPDEQTAWRGNAQRASDDRAKLAALWVKVVEGCSQGYDWGGHLQIIGAAAQDRYLDSSDGWIKAVATPGDRIMFYAMGSHYEIWQKSRETGRPLTIHNYRLRFVEDALPGRWNIRT